MNLFANNAQIVSINPNSDYSIVAVPGVRYAVVEGNKVETAALQGDVIVLRQGDDLVMRYANGAQVTIRDFFVVCDGGVCEAVELIESAVRQAPWQRQWQRTLFKVYGVTGQTDKAQELQQRRKEHVLRRRAHLKRLRVGDLGGVDDDELRSLLRVTAGPA